MNFRSFYSLKFRPFWTFLCCLLKGKLHPCAGIGDCSLFFFASSVAICCNRIRAKLLNCWNWEGCNETFFCKWAVIESTEFARFKPLIFGKFYSIFLLYLTAKFNFSLYTHVLFFDGMFYMMTYRRCPFS